MSGNVDLHTRGTEGGSGAGQQDQPYVPGIPGGETAETAESAGAAIDVDPPPALATAAGPTAAAVGTLVTATHPADAVPSHADPLGTSRNAECGGVSGRPSADGCPSSGSISQIYLGRLFATRSMAGVVKIWSSSACHSPLVPLRPAKAADEVARDSRRASPRWVPVDGSWDRPMPAADLTRFFRENPRARIGVKLGKPGPGEPWLIEIIVKAQKMTDPRLKRMFGDYSVWTVQWRAGDRTHYLFLGDDRLAAFAPLVAGEKDAAGRVVGNRHCLGVEIRLGHSPSDPVGALAVLPPTPGAGGRSRQWVPYESILPLPQSFYEAFTRFAGSGEEGTTAAAPNSPPREEAPPGGEGQATEESVESRVPPAPGSDDATVEGRPAGPDLPSARGGPALHGFDAPSPSLPGTVVSEDDGTVASGPDHPAQPPALKGELLTEESLRAKRIKRVLRRGVKLVRRGLEDFRQAGEMFRAAKKLYGKRKFRAWIKAEFDDKYRTVAGYVRLAERWDELQLIIEKVQPVAPPTLKEALKLLAKPRPKTDVARDAPPASVEGSASGEIGVKPATAPDGHPSTSIVSTPPENGDTSIGNDAALPGEPRTSEIAAQSRTPDSADPEKGPVFQTGDVVTATEPVPHRAGVEYRVNSSTTVPTSCDVARGDDAIRAKAEEIHRDKRSRSDRAEGRRKARDLSGDDATGSTPLTPPVEPLALSPRDPRSYPLRRELADPIAFDVEVLAYWENADRRDRSGRAPDDHQRPAILFDLAVGAIPIITDLWLCVLPPDTWTLCPFCEGRQTNDEGAICHHCRGLGFRIEMLDLQTKWTDTPVTPGGDAGGDGLPDSPSPEDRGSTPRKRRRVTR